MIAVIDSGVANLASVMAALQRLNADAVVTSDAAVIRSASHVILPGVGAAPAAMAQLHAKKLVEVVRGLTQPVLGICLGMQLLFEGSQEGRAEDERYLPCIGVISGMIKRMTASVEHPIPHMGWNQIIPMSGSHSLLEGIDSGSYVYFVHSYAAPVGPDTIATSDYSVPFTAVAKHNNFMGCQFHPERSSAVGSRILQNFLGL